MSPAQFTSTGYNPPTLPKREAPAMTESKKIDATFRDGEGDRLTVRTEDESLGAYVKSSGAGVYVSPADAPAVALAILEAAGHDATTGPGTAYMVARAVRNLRQAAHLKAAREAREADLAAQAEAEATARAVREAADAADLAELDREAWALYKAHWGMTGGVPDYFVAESPGQIQERDRWRKVARAARAQREAPAPRIKPTWEIVERRTSRNQFLVVNHETRRVWPCGPDRENAERVLGIVLIDDTYGYSRDLADDDLVDTVVPRPALFPVVSGYRDGKHEYGVWDRDKDRVAPFGSLSGAQSGARAIPDCPEGWSWFPVADYTGLSEVVL